jgi:hypothetical protein
MQIGTPRTRALVATAATTVGLAVGVAGVAGAATSSTTTTTTPTATAPSAAHPPAMNPATVSHGPGETLLTGSSADRVRAAALAAVPGATILRVETDSAGSPYEAHLRKADGSYVTVKVNTSFAATATQNGFGAGPAGQPMGGAPMGGAPSGPPPAA